MPKPDPVVPGTRLTEWVLSRLPAPPARVLEVGCGSGRLARALSRAGYNVVAVDPIAPRGAIFRRCRIEDLNDEGRFHAAVASTSLHHVESLAVVVGKIHGLLRPGGRLIVNEFAWDRFDRRTATWLFERRRALSRVMRRRYVGPSPVGSYARWRRSFGHLHRYQSMRAALDRRFTTQFFGWTPYLYYYPGSVTTEPRERRLIESDAIAALGFRYVGRRR